MSEKTEITVSFDTVLVRVPCGTCQAESVWELFERLSQAGACVDLISLVPPRRSQRGGLTFSVINCDVAKVMKAAYGVKQCCNSDCIEVCGGYSKIVLRGGHFPETTGVAASFFKALRSANVELAMVASSLATISALMPTEELDKTVAALEKAFPDAETVYPT